jgi:cytochrome c553
MSEPRLLSFRNPWLTGSIALTVLIAVSSAAIGFIWLPSLQSDARNPSLWYAICTAAGLVRAVPDEGIPVAAAYKTTDVIVTPRMLHGASGMSIGLGATLALRCTMCHGARGLSEADSPNLAGQYAQVIYKELQDYKSGARTNAVMSPRVTNLSDQDMRDLAAYYAYLPRLPPYHPPTAGPVPRIVASGAPMRNIAPCAACHGTLAYKVGSAWLEGQSPVYLQRQLAEFAESKRHNDISEQMRNVARNMTPAEMEEAAQWYSSQP